MNTYYNADKTATITDRGKIAAITRLLEACEAAGVVIVDDPSPNQVGGVFFEDVYGCTESGDFLGFEEIRRRHTRSDLVIVDGWVYENSDGCSWAPIFDPCDIERDAYGSAIVTELCDGGRRPLYEISILSEDETVNVQTGVFTENSYASTIWADSEEAE